jgi:hypothetical protein
MQRLEALRTGSLVWATAAAGVAHAAEPIANWFNDPFFQVSGDVVPCPLPAGPFVTEREKAAQSHRRAEKGTTCWLAKECERPNAYAYDADIAASIKSAVRGQRALAGTTIWVTVQGRVVYVEGCAGSNVEMSAIENLVRDVEFVQQAIFIVRTDPAQRPPYRLRSLE